MMESTVAVITDYGRPTQTWRVSLPELPQGTALAQGDAATLCGTDAHRWQGHLSRADNADQPFVPLFAPPFVLGHETCGTLTDTGVRATTSSASG